MKTVENMSLPSRLASQAPFFSPTLYPCLIPPAPRLSFHKKNYFFSQISKMEANVATSKCMK